MRGWELYLESDKVRNILWAAKVLLRGAWKKDLRHPRSYPLHTSVALEQIERIFRKKEMRAAREKFFPDPRTLKKLTHLIPEKTVRIVWQDHHAETFDQALRKAGSIGRRGVSLKDGWKAFKAIERAMEIAYLVTFYGDDFLPKPKNSILHRGLDQIVRMAGLQDLTTAGFAEFLDDLCPCGLKSHKESVRKMESRTPEIRRPRG